MSSEYSFITLIWFNITMFVYVDLDCSRKWKLPANVSNEKCLNNRKTFFLILSLLLFHVRYKKITEEMESVQEASASPSEIIISTIISFFITYAKEVIFTLFFFSTCVNLLVCWFIIRITQQLLIRVPTNADGHCVNFNINITFWCWSR